MAYLAGKFVSLAISIRSSDSDLLGLFAGEICGAGVEKRANGACRRKEFDVAKQRQLRNGSCTTKALECRVEGNVDAQRRLGTNVLNGDEQHADQPQ